MTDKNFSVDDPTEDMARFLRSMATYFMELPAECQRDETSHKMKAQHLMSIADQIEEMADSLAYFAFVHDAILSIIVGDEEE